jgi:hypothetical protein
MEKKIECKRCPIISLIVFVGAFASSVIFGALIGALIPFVFSFCKK